MSLKIKIIINFETNISIDYMRNGFNIYGKWWFLIYFAALVVALIFTYLAFTFYSDNLAGPALEKSNWLSFWGSYLGIAGTILLSIIAVRQNNKINNINSELIKIQIAEKMPFIHVSFNDVYAKFRFLENNVKDILQKSKINTINENTPIMKLEKKEYEYFVFSSSCVELEKGFPDENETFIKSNQSPNCQILIKKVLIHNIGNNAAVNIQMFYNKEKISDEFNLGVNQIQTFLFIFSEDLGETEFNFRIEYTVLDSQKYYQDFAYYFKLKGGGGYEYRVTKTKFPRKIEV